MRRLLVLPVFLSILIGIPSIANAQVQFLFSTMEDGDEIAVDYSSTGCFHSDNGTMNFKRDGKKLSLTVNGRERVIAIQAIRLKSLDQQLRTLRRRRDQGGCTTQTQTTYTFKENGKAVHTERLVDGDCAVKDYLGPLLEFARR